MDFKLSNSKSESTLISTNRNLKNRWCVLTPSKLEKDIGGNWTWFNSVSQRKSNKLERTRLYLGYDDVVLRPVIVKVVKYNLDDVATRESVIKKRKVLSSQIELLNDISSPLLPEPLDWFNVENSVEGLPTDELCKTEPVLVLDYMPGVTLEYQTVKKAFRRPNKGTNIKDTKTENIEEIVLNVEKIARLIDYIRYFFEQIYNKGYMYVGLSIDEILVLKDDVPRFLGLGRICKLKNGKLDDTHINFNRTVIGYSAPEFKELDKYYTKNPDAKAVAAFNLGVILAQLMCESTSFERDARDKNGYFKYPNPRYEEKIKAISKKGYMIHDLLVKLCDPNPETRLKDFKEIERILTDIKGDSLKPSREYQPKRYRVEIQKGITGVIKFYDDEKEYGYLVEKSSQEQYKFKKEQLEKGGLTTVTKGQQVIFEKAIRYNEEDGSEKTYINVIEKDLSTHIRTAPPKPIPSTPVEPINPPKIENKPKKSGGIFGRIVDWLS